MTRSSGQARAAGRKRLRQRSNGGVVAVDVLTCFHLCGAAANCCRAAQQPGQLKQHQRRRPHEYSSFPRLGSAPRLHEIPICTPNLGARATYVSLEHWHPPERVQIRRRQPRRAAQAKDASWGERSRSPPPFLGLRHAGGARPVKVPLPPHARDAVAASVAVASAAWQEQSVPWGWAHGFWYGMGERVCDGRRALTATHHCVDTIM
eukprot:scaffold2707_cov417-Prasinococcus_capsulatus_cf.AAC.20